MPPSTAITCPVMKRPSSDGEHGDHRRDILGRAELRREMMTQMHIEEMGVLSGRVSVMTNPGAMELHRTPCLPYCAATYFVSVSTAAFAEA
jgi:hypothetical protein